MQDLSALASRIEADGVRTIDLRFTDLAGNWQHLSYGARASDLDRLARGVFFDGSSVPGWQEVTSSDLALIPDPQSAFLDPFAAQPTLVILADVAEPDSGEGYPCDPRSVAKRAEAAVTRSSGAERVVAGPEMDFFLFDDVRFETGRFGSMVKLSSEEASEHTALAYQGGNPGHRPGVHTGRRPLPPIERFADLRAEIAGTMEDLGAERLRHAHGELPGQNRVDFAPCGLTLCADRMQIFKYVVHNTAAAYQKSATFMAQPLGEGPGQSLHVHQALWKAGKPLFAGTDYADVSQICLHYIAGILHHAHALNAFLNPTVNSYRRLQPGMHTPIVLAYSAHNRSAALRVPYSRKPDDKRIEVRFADPTANPYLALSAIVMAGLDGVARKLDPGDPMDMNLYDLPPEALRDLDTVCASLEQACTALEEDHEFLMRDDVFPRVLIDAYIEQKRQDVAVIAKQPTAGEFALYYSR
ncbi:MAG: type I glutamate--ammonia ligase [Geminicoccaceae bacterium]